MPRSIGRPVRTGNDNHVAVRVLDERDDRRTELHRPGRTCDGAARLQMVLIGVVLVQKDVVGLFKCVPLA